MSLKLFRFGVMFALLLVVGAVKSPVLAQYKSPYDLRFLKARTVEAVGEKSVLVLLQVLRPDQYNTPVLDKQVTFTLRDNDPTQTARLGEGVRLVVYKDSLPERAPVIYNYIKDKIDKGGNQPIILAFYFPIAPDEELGTMRFSYGLRTKQNSKQRVERRFEFVVED